MALPSLLCSLVPLSAPQPYRLRCGCVKRYYVQSPPNRPLGTPLCPSTKATAWVLRCKVKNNFAGVQIYGGKLGGDGRVTLGTDAYGVWTSIDINLLSKYTENYPK